MASRSTRCVGWGRRRPQGQRSRAGKCAAEEAGCRSRLRQGDPARGVEADFLSPSRHREAIEQVRRVLPVSEQQTCRVLVQHRSTQRHRPKDDADEQRLTADIIALVKDYGRYGYRRIHALLGHAGWQVSLSVVERIWRREGLKVPKRQPKRRRLWLGDGSCIRLRPRHHGHVWSYDFVEDQTRNGRKFRMLNIIDEFSRECLTTVPVERRDRRADRSVHRAWAAPAYRVRQRPRVRRPCGTQLALPSRCDHPVHRGGQSLGECYIERLSFARLRPNARLRDELLNGEVFYSLEEVRCVTGCGAIITTGYGRTAASATAHQLPKRSRCQPGRSAPLRFASRQGWHRKCGSANHETGPVIAGSPVIGLGLPCPQRPS